MSRCIVVMLLYATALMAQRGNIRSDQIRQSDRHGSGSKILMTDGTTLPAPFADVGGEVHVKDYGAVGDGVADDTTAWQNAINAVQGTDKLLNCNDGNYKITASLSITLAPFTLEGNRSCTITWAGTAGLTIISIAANNTTIRGCTITAGNAGNAIANSGSRTRLRIADNIITGSDRPINFNAGSDIEIFGNRLSGFLTDGIAIATAVTITQARIVDNYVDGTSSTTLNGASIGVWGSHAIIANNYVKIGGNRDQGIVFLNSVGAGLTNGSITGNVIEMAGSNSLECIGLGSANGFAVTGNTCRMTGTFTGANFYGIEVNRSFNGTVSSNVFVGNDPTVEADAIVVLSSDNIVVDGNSITGWGTAGLGIALTHTTAAATMTNIMVSNNVLVQSAATSAIPDIRLETLTTGTVKNVTFANNYIFGTTAVGHVCLKLANSGAATVTGLRVQGNTLDTCTLGIEIAGSGTWSDGNRMTNATSLYSGIAATTVLLDQNGIAFASLATPANGSLVFCSDCTIANPCAGTGTGALAKRLNDVWVCN